MTHLLDGHGSGLHRSVILQLVSLFVLCACSQQRGVVPPSAASREPTVALLAPPPPTSVTVSRAEIRSFLENVPARPSLVMASSIGEPYSINAHSSARAYAGDVLVASAVERSHLWSMEPSLLLGRPNASKALPVFVSLVGTSGELGPALQAVLEIEGGGLRYDRARRAYATHLQVGLEAVDSPGVRQSLGPGVLVSITAGLDSVLPSEVLLHNTGSYERVLLVALDPDSAVVNVRVRVGALRVRPVDVPVKILPKGILLEASPEIIQGFGIESAFLTVSALRLSGLDSVTVTLSARRSRLDRQQVRATRTQPAQASLRSRSYGIDTVTARAGLAQDFVVVQYLFPSDFILAAVIGGIIGWVLLIVNDYRKTRQKEQRSKLLWRLGSCIIAAFIAACLSALGINIFRIDITASQGEVAILVIGVIAALVPDFAGYLRGVTIKPDQAGG